MPVRILPPAARLGTRLPQQPAEDDPSALRSPGSGLGSGLHYIGTTLNKPSRALWGTLEGLSSGDWSGGGPLNLLPFSDTFGLTDPDRGVELSRFLENRGVIPKNKPGFDAWDIPRFGLDVLGDPLSFTTGTFTAKALGPGGQALRRAGVLPDLTRASGKGPREYLSGTGFRESLKGLSRDELRSVQRAAKGMGYRGLKDLAEQAPGPLGGQLGLNLPFGSPRTTFGSPGLGRAIDTGLQRAAESPLGLETQRLFSPVVRGGRNVFEQMLGRKTFEGREVVERQADSLTQQWEDAIRRSDPDMLDTPEGMSRFRTQLESVYDNAAAADVPFDVPKEQFIDDIHGAIRGMHALANKYGYDVGTLKDAFVEFAPRGKHGPIFDAHEMARHGHLTDWPGGTEAIREVMADPSLHELLDTGASEKTLEKFLREKWGNPLSPDSPLAMESAVDEVLQEQMHLWKEPFRTGERAFRKKHAAAIRKIQKGADIDQFQHFDELGEDYLSHTGVPATNEEAFEALMRTDPRPTRQTVQQEAAERLARQQEELGFSEGLDELAPSNEFVVRDSKGRPKLDAEGNEIVGNRWREVAKTAKGMTPEQRKVGLFRQNPLDDVYRYLSSLGRRYVVGKSTVETLRDPSFVRDAVAASPRDMAGAVPLRHVLKNPAAQAAREAGGSIPPIDMGLNPHTIAREALGIDEAVMQQPSLLKEQFDKLPGGRRTKAEREALKAARAAKRQAEQKIREFLDTPVKKSVADQMVKMARFGTEPKEQNLLHRAYLWFHNTFKGSVTSPWLAFHGRNWIGSQIQNIMVGILRPWRMIAENLNTYRLVQGQVIPDAHTIPVVRRMLKERRLEANAENGTQMLRELASTERVWDSRGATGWGTDIIGGAEGTEVEPLSRLLERQPGRTPLFGESGPVREIASRYIGRPTERAPNVTLSPLKAEMRGGWAGAERSTFGPFAAGELAGAWIEGQNRLPAFMDLLRQGVDPREAARRVAAAQVDYSARSFTEFERALKQVVPFYSFQKKMATYVAGELANRPGGPMAQVIKQQARAGEEDLHGEAAIPLGETPSGSRRYLTGLGLMHEGSALNMLSSRGGALSPSETLSQVLGATTPLIKGPLEAVSGQSFFQRGPLGGRPTVSQDPLAGGVVANVGQLFGGERPYPAQPLGGSVIGRRPAMGVEQLLANSPLSRLLSTARTATDIRKYEGGLFPGAALAAQLGTGLRISDISERQKLRMLKDQVLADIRDEGGYVGQFAAHTKKDIEQAEKSDPERAEQMKARNKLLSEIRRLEQELNQEERERPKIRFRRAG